MLRRQDAGAAQHVWVCALCERYVSVQATASGDIEAACVLHRVRCVDDLVVLDSDLDAHVGAILNNIVADGRTAAGDLHSGATALLDQTVLNDGCSPQRQCTGVSADRVITAGIFDHAMAKDGVIVHEHARPVAGVLFRARGGKHDRFCCSADSGQAAVGSFDVAVVDESFRVQVQDCTCLDGNVVASRESDAAVDEVGDILLMPGDIAARVEVFIADDEDILLSGEGARAAESVERNGVNAHRMFCATGERIVFEGREPGVFSQRYSVSRRAFDGCVRDRYFAILQVNNTVGRIVFEAGVIEARSFSAVAKLTIVDNRRGRGGGEKVDVSPCAGSGAVVGGDKLDRLAGRTLGDKFAVDVQ